MKKHLFGIFIFLNLLPIISFGTESGGERVSFVGFVGESQKYALLLTGSVFLEPGEDEFDTIASLVKMDSCTSEIIETVNISDSTGTLSEAFFDENMSIFFDYFKKKSKNKTVKDLKLNNRNTKPLVKVKVPVEIKRSKSEFKKWVKAARFRTNSNNALIATLKKQNKVKGNGFVPVLTIGSQESLGQIILTNQTPSIVYYSTYKKYIPSEIDAYSNGNDEIIVFGAVAYKPEFRGRFSPFIAVWPNKACGQIE